MTRVAPQRASAGVATLSIVMVLFFVMALVAAYTNRNLLFEQRTAANNYRSERALVAADAGVDWAIAMLNGSRIDLHCVASTTATDGDYRRRYLTIDNTGAYNVVANIYPGCNNTGGSLTCICPTAATPTLTPDPIQDWAIDAGGTAFRVEHILLNNLPRTGTAILIVRGCGSTGTGTTACAEPTINPVVDGLARVISTVGLVRALPVPPVAALTAAGSITASAGAVSLSIANGDASTGITAHAGGALTIDPSVTGLLVGPAGSPGNGSSANDAVLAGLKPTVANRFTANDQLFRATFGFDAPTYRRQPGVVRIDCSGGCAATDLQNALDANPMRTLWFDGNLTIDAVPASGPTFGTSAEPLMAIVTGTLTMQAATGVVGLVYATDIAWTGAANLVGAAIAANNFNSTAAATISYDAAVLSTINLGYGSFVRAPGGWNRLPS